MADVTDVLPLRREQPDEQATAEPCAALPGLGCVRPAGDVCAYPVRVAARLAHASFGRGARSTIPLRGATAWTVAA